LRLPPSQPALQPRPDRPRRAGVDDERESILEHILSPTETTASTSDGWRNLSASVARFQCQKVKLRPVVVGIVFFLNLGLDSVEFVSSDPVTG
jgi:hypothetical protein